MHYAALLLEMEKSPTYTAFAFRRKHKYYIKYTEKNLELVTLK